MLGRAGDTVKTRGHGDRKIRSEIVAHTPAAHHIYFPTATQNQEAVKTRGVDIDQKRHNIEHNGEHYIRDFAKRKFLKIKRGRKEEIDEEKSRCLNPRKC